MIKNNSTTSTTTKEETQLREKVVGYGVNVKIADTTDNRIEWVRLTTCRTLTHAKTVYEWMSVLLKDPNQELLSGAEIVKITELENGDFNYTCLRDTNTDDMLSKDFWEKQIASYKGVIDNFSINEDQNPDGSPINICWLTLGWVSLDSDHGFFYYSSVEEFKRQILAVKPLARCDRFTMINYLDWLTDNPHLLKGYTDANRVVISLLRHPEVEEIKKQFTSNHK